MNRHSREEIVLKARFEFDDFYIKFLRDNDITYVELQSILIEKLASQNRYMLRIERHGNEDDPAGLE